jgi:RimJ/RimL family protein N-acetyltransferase
MVIAQVEGYTILPLQLAQLPGVYRLFRSIPPEYPFFNDNLTWVMKDETSFANWVFRNWSDAVVGLTDSAEVMACSFLTKLQKGHKACIAEVFLPGYWKPGLTKAMALEVMAYFFDKWDLAKLEGYVDQDNRLARIYNTRIGLKNTGILRHNVKKNGVLVDQIVFSILREELNGDGQG